MASAKYLLKFTSVETQKQVTSLLEFHGLSVDTTHAQDEHVVIVAASSDRLAHTAEKVKLVKPLKDSEEVDEFTVANNGNFQWFSQHCVFSPAEESWLLYHTIQQTPYDCNHGQATIKREMGYLSWLHSGKHPMLEEAYPLHIAKDREALSSELKWSFAPWRQLNVSMVRDYFGEEVGFYFAWMNFYSMFLLLPAMVGCIMYLLRPSSSSVDNDPYLPFYSVFISIWGVLFIRFWQRQSATHSFHWNTSKLNPVDKLRAEFYGTQQVNPITGKLELFYPHWKRRLWHFFSAVCMIPLLLLGVGAMTLSLNLNGYVKHTDSPIYVGSLTQYSQPGGLFAADSKYYGWLVPTIMHSIIISVINNLYSYIAEKCTDLENHRTTQSWHTSLVIKRVSFECFDCFMPLFYIAFYQMDVVTLRTEITSLFMSDEIRRILLESLLPFLKEVFLSKRMQYKSKGKRDQCKSGNCPPVDIVLTEYDEFDDYLEMVIQFGYVTLFAAAFPLGPTVTLLFVYLELRSDFFKLLHAYRRPLPRRTKDIGVWFSVMQAMVFASILTNCAIMSFSSEQMMQWLPWLFERSGEGGDQTPALGRGRYVVGIMFAMEHLIIMAALFLMWLIHPVPKKIRVAIARRKYLSKQRAPLTIGKSKTE